MWERWASLRKNVGYIGYTLYAVSLFNFKPINSKMCKENKDLLGSIAPHCNHT